MNILGEKEVRNLEVVLTALLSAAQEYNSDGNHVRRRIRNTCREHLEGRGILYFVYKDQAGQHRHDVYAASAVS